MPLNPIDLTKGSFRLFSPQDSAFQEIQTGISVHNNVLSFKTDGYACSNVRFEIDSGAIEGVNGSVNSAIKTVIQRKEPKDLGTLNVDVITDIAHWFISLQKDGKEIAIRTNMSGSQPVIFENLIPGNYTVNIVADTNENQIWDPFQPDSFSPPERRFSFGRKTSVKANFEHEIEFIIPQ
jgi:uncharacterized protein (DUF2141 family)